MPHRGGARGVGAARLPPEPRRNDGARLGQLRPAHSSDQHRAPRVSAGESGERSGAPLGGRDLMEGRRRERGRMKSGGTWGFTTLVLFKDRAMSIDGCLKDLSKSKIRQCKCGWK